MNPLPRYIELETSRLCNRTCPWCPDGVLNHRSVQELMPWQTFVGFVEELAALEYAGWLALHNFNEPLANPRLDKELSHLHTRLPLAKLSLFTNGDFLDRKRLRELERLGLVHLRVSVYPRALLAAPIEPTHEALWHWLRNKRLADFLSWTPCPARQGAALEGLLGSLRIELLRPNVLKYNWRGGTVLSLSAPTRSAPCVMTQHSASIDYRGRLKMCCNIVPEELSHARYVAGTIAEQSFLALWRSTAMKSWRVAHLASDWTLSPVCTGCSHRLPAEQEAEFLAPDGA